jgi:Eukaryotic-type carbonic anhydrase
MTSSINTSLAFTKFSSKTKTTKSITRKGKKKKKMKTILFSIFFTIYLLFSIPASSQEVGMSCFPLNFSILIRFLSANISLIRWTTIIHYQLGISFLLHNFADDERPFSYKLGAKNGPQNWGKLNATWDKCSTGQQQSPIDISVAKATANPTLGGLLLLYRPAKGILVNRGHDIEVIITPLL